MQPWHITWHATIACINSSTHITWHATVACINSSTLGSQRSSHATLFLSALGTISSRVIQGESNEHHTVQALLRTVSYRETFSNYFIKWYLLGCLSV